MNEQTAPMPEQWGRPVSHPDGPISTKIEPDRQKKTDSRPRLQDGFRERLAAASRHEHRVTVELRRRGWTAEQFGQAQMSPRVRDHLHQTSSPVRWLPDIIAARNLGDGRTRVIFVDAKLGRSDTGYHAVELAAVDAAERWVAFAQCPTYFVLGDHHDVATPDTVRATGKPGPDHGHGSGRPYLLVPRVACRPFAIFGSPDGDRQ